MTTELGTMEKKNRLVFLDVLRGFDMFWIIGGAGVFKALAALTGWAFWKSFAEQLKHPAWNGFTAFDLIFPLFVFLSGMTLGIANRKLSGLPWAERKSYYFKAVRRLVILIVLGVIYNHGWGRGIPAELETARYASVLARIAIAWFLAAMIVWHTGLRTQICIAVGILLGYWAILYWIPVPGHGAGVLTPTGCINGWIDTHLLPGMTHGNRPLDPEGLLSSLPAVVNALIGCWCGRFIKEFKRNDWQKAGIIFATGLLLLGGGWIWDYGFPVNKTLWTSSFVFVTCGWSLILTSIFYTLFDLIPWKGMRYLALPWMVIGANAIVIYVLSSLIHWNHTANSLVGGFIKEAPKDWQWLLTALAIVVIKLLLLAWMYRRKIFVRV